MIQPPVTPPTVSSDLHDLQKWSWAVRGEQLLHLLHTGYATVVGFCKPTGLARCHTHTRHDHGSKLKFLPIPIGIFAGFDGYVPTTTFVHISSIEAQFRVGQTIGLVRPGAITIFKVQEKFWHVSVDGSCTWPVNTDSVYRLAVLYAFSDAGGS